MSRGILGFCATHRREASGARSDRKEKKQQDEKCGRHWSSSARPTPAGFRLSGIGVIKYSDSILNSSGLKFSHIQFSPNGFLAHLIHEWVMGRFSSEISVSHMHELSHIDGFTMCFWPWCTAACIASTDFPSVQIRHVEAETNTRDQRKRRGVHVSSCLCYRLRPTLRRATRRKQN